MNLLPIPVLPTNRVQIPFDEGHPLKKSTFKLFFGLQHYQGSFPNTPQSVSRRKKRKKLSHGFPWILKKQCTFLVGNIDNKWCHHSFLKNWASQEADFCLNVTYLTLLLEILRGKTGIFWGRLLNPNFKVFFISIPSIKKAKFWYAT